MFLVLLLIFIVVPVVELSVLIRVGEVLGSLTTVALVLLTAVVGVSLVRSQGLSTLMLAQQKLARGETPTGELIEGMMLALAGVLLLIPGFVTDFIGLLLLTPISRRPLARLLLTRLNISVVGRSGFGGGRGPFAGPGRDPFNSQGPFKGHGGNTFEGDYEHKEDAPDAKPRLDQQDKGAKPRDDEGKR